MRGPGPQPQTSVPVWNLPDFALALTHDTKVRCPRQSFGASDAKRPGLGRRLPRGRRRHPSEDRANPTRSRPGAGSRESVVFGQSCPAPEKLVARRAQARARWGQTCLTYTLRLCRLTLADANVWLREGVPRLHPPAAIAWARQALDTCHLPNYARPQRPRSPAAQVPNSL